jgi:hypothetical protein
MTTRLGRFQNSTCWLALVWSHRWMLTPFFGLSHEGQDMRLASIDVPIDWWLCLVTSLGVITCRALVRAVSLRVGRFDNQILAFGGQSNFDLWRPARHWGDFLDPILLERSRVGSQLAVSTEQPNTNLILIVRRSAKCLRG